MKPKTRKRNTKKQITATGKKQNKKELEAGFVPALVAVLGALSPFLAGPISNILNRGADWLGKKIFGSGKNSVISTNELLDKLSGDLTINKQQAKAVIRDKLGRLPTKVKVVLPVEKEKIEIQNTEPTVGAGIIVPKVDPHRKLASIEVGNGFRPAFTKAVTDPHILDPDLFKNQPNRIPTFNPNFKL